MIELADLESRYDFEGAKQRVSAAIGGAAADPASLFTLLLHYGSWNAMFGAGVASLAAKIVRSRAFSDPKERIRMIADRSVLVASYFFDAARDEFDDRASLHRDTHRCLCQAFLKGVFWYFEDRGVALSPDAEPAWLTALEEKVAAGYGVGTPDDAPHVFRAMGYHLGSELLADSEFSVIDETLEQSAPALVSWLGKKQIDIAGEKHDAYLWVRAHSGHGGGAEADHFDWAIRGVRAAFQYIRKDLHAALDEEVLRGFDQFTREHDEFFSQEGRKV